AIESRLHTHIYRTYAVEWGDYRHLLAIVMLMREACRHADLEYFHLVTGSDYPVMPLAQFKVFCEQHRSDNYMEYFSLPHDDWGREGGLDRIQYWWLRPNSTRTCGARLTRRLVNLQRRLGIKRAFKYFNGKLYGGGTYWSLSREAVEMAVDYLGQHLDYLRRFRHTSIAEEICLPTLLVNSGITLINNYKRYIDWGTDGGNPQ
ncbi:MAG: beta-1,6-N-acetylglucosaminyltransferase, partial [Prevotella sp.]